MTAGATLFFVPFAGVGPMMVQACVVARALKDQGHHVLVTRCFELFDRCPVKNMYALPCDASAAAIREVCLKCADNSLTMVKEYGLDVLDLRSLVTENMIADVDHAMSSVGDELLAFAFDDIPLGIISGVDLLLTRKLLNLTDVTADDRLLWRQHLRSALLSYRLIDRACREYGVARLIYPNENTTTLSARMAARKNGIPSYNMTNPSHLNVDFRRYVIQPSEGIKWAFDMVESWPACRSLPLSPETVREIADDLLIRFAASGMLIYSPPKTNHDVRSRLGLAAGRTLLVAYTSSPDEPVGTSLVADVLGLRFPERPQPFDTQIAWLRALTSYVEASDDLQLVVRVHPREAPNKRDRVTSQHLGRLRAAFDGEYRHCRFVWPQDPISSYDLGEAADLVLIWGSTLGLEMARLGVPVLAAHYSTIYGSLWDDFLEWSESEAGYFEVLRRVLKQPLTIDRIARAFRWYSLSVFGRTVNLGDLIPEPAFDGLPVYRLPAEAATIAEVIIHGRSLREINIERLKAAEAPESHARELDELRRQLRRLVHYLMTEEQAEVDVPLMIGSSHGAARSAVVTGHTVRYQVGDRVFTRESPMVARLLPLCGEQCSLPLGNDAALMATVIDAVSHA